MESIRQTTVISKRKASTPRVSQLSWVGVSAWLFLPCLLAEPARGTVINFDSLSAMASSAGSPVPGFAQLSNQLHPTTGAVFSSLTTNYVAVVELGVAHAPSELNGIGGVNDLGQLDFSEAIIVDFFDPTNIGVPVTVSSASIQGDLAPSAGNNIHMQAFNIGGSLVDFDDQADLGGTTLSVSAPDIHRLVIFSDVANVGFDNLTFPTIPEPGTLSLLAVCALPLLLRRRRE
ncbi:MAG: hypothetical protein MI923_12110 [Phycisphaerales bacterium]|nr:hypothetical protein [Phycisphaerales bacterium]